MLKQALRQKGQGTDVAAGVVDPHGHACTARLLAALERLAGPALAKDGEIDLDAVLARAPTLVLVCLLYTSGQAAATATAARM